MGFILLVMVASKVIISKIVIRDNAYIGMRANIIARTDIEIGEKAVVGACTLVNKSIPAGKTVVGIPCKIVD